MPYFVGIEILLLSSLAVAKLIAFPRLSTSSKITLLERWSTNFSLEIVNRVIAVTVSMLLIQNLNFKNTHSENWFYFLFYIVVLDFTFYWRHRIYHRWFWFFHRTHHSDTGYDFSLSLRIHPIETLIQITLFVSISQLMNINQWHIFLAVHIFSVQALLSHLDYAIPKTTITRILRNIFVFPDSHKFHHDPENPDNHFGFLFSFWDTIFGTNQIKKID